MKQKILFGFLVGFILSSFFLTGCNKKDNPTASNEDECGGITALDWVFTPTDLQINFPYAYLSSDGKRTYTLYQEADSICTDLHLNGEFTATMSTANGANFSFQAAIKWYILWEARDIGIMDFTTDRVNWSGSITNVGLKQVFGENAGSVSSNIYITFPTRGSEQLDSAYLMNNFIVARMHIPYRWHKPEGSANTIDPGSYKDFIFANDSRKYLYKDFYEIPIPENKVVIIRPDFN